MLTQEQKAIILQKWKQKLLIDKQYKQEMKEMCK